MSNFFSNISNISNMVLKAVDKSKTISPAHLKNVQTNFNNETYRPIYKYDYNNDGVDDYSDLTEMRNQMIQDAVKDVISGKLDINDVDSNIKMDVKKACIEYIGNLTINQQDTSKYKELFSELDFQSRYYYVLDGTYSSDHLNQFSYEYTIDFLVGYECWRQRNGFPLDNNRNVAASYIYEKVNEYIATTFTKDVLLDIFKSDDYNDYQNIKDIPENKGIKTSAPPTTVSDKLKGNRPKPPKDIYESYTFEQKKCIGILEKNGVFHMQIII